jgi:hypothetical protein
MPVSKKPKTPTEWLLVTDKTSKVLKSSLDRYELVRLANVIRRAGGEVTIFRSTNL